MKPTAIALTDRPAAAIPAAAVDWRPLAALAASTLLAALGTSVANVALPTLAAAFGAPFGAVQWVVLSYLLAVTTLVVAAGRIGDVVGRRELLLAGIVLFSAGSLLSAFAPTLALLVAARALQGAGAAGMMALTLSFASAVVPAPRLGRVVGLLGTMSAVGTALGPSVGGLVIGTLGWRALFAGTASLGAATLLLAWRHLPRAPRSGALRDIVPDLPRLSVLGAALAAYALAMTVGREWMVPLLALAGAGVLAFVRAERRASRPLLGMAALREPALRNGLALIAIVTTVVMAAFVVGPFYLTDALGLGATALGLVMATGPVVSALAGVPSGRLTDRLGAKRTAAIGLGSMFGGSLLLTVLPIAAGIVGYVLPIALVTGGYAIVQTAANAAALGAAGPERRGVVSGLLGLARNLGLVTGASAMGAVYAVSAAGAGSVAAGAEAGMRWTFGVAAALVAGAVLLVRGVRTR